MDMLQGLSCGGSGDFSGNTLYKVLGSTTVKRDYFSNMAATLLAMMLMIIYVCEGALLRKSTATDFLQRVKEKRAAECLPEDCSTEVVEAEELTEGYEEHFSLVYDGGATQTEMNHSPGGEAVVEEGSGM